MNNIIYKKTRPGQVKNTLNELDKLVHRSSRILLDVRAVFPFNFFPDEIVVDETKVSIHTNYFFYSKQIRSVAFSDIFNVTVQKGILFAKLEIVDRFFTRQPIIIRYLRIRDAKRARRIIQGMMVVKKEKIKTSQLKVEKLISLLEKIGKSR